MQDDTQTQPTAPVTEETTSTSPEPPEQQTPEENNTDDTTVQTSTAPDENTQIREQTDEESEGSSETPAEQTNSDTQTALSIMQIENMINSQMVEIEKVRDEVKLLKSSFEDAFKNDAKYREFDEKVKEATKLKKQYVQAMKKDPSIQAAEQQFVNRRDDLKDLQIGLSDYLREYNRVSGLTQFETEDGQVLQIVQTFKLVKK